MASGSKRSPDSSDLELGETLAPSDDELANTMAAPAVGPAPTPAPDDAAIATDETIASTGGGRGPGEPTTGQGTRRLDAALNSMSAPFVASGIAAPDPVDVPCEVAGRKATCRATELTIAPSATLHLLAGQPHDADWLMVCLDRDPKRVGVCAGRIARTP